MNTKRCIRCKQYKSLDKFCSDKSEKDKLNKYCKRCASPNPDKYGTFKKRGKKLERGKEWCGHCKKYKKISDFGTNGGKLRWQCKSCHVAMEHDRYFSMSQSERDAYNKATYKKVSEKYIEQGTTYGKETYRKNREQSLADAKRWYKNNKKRRRIYMREYFKRKPEKFAQIRHKRRALLHGAEGEYSDRQWNDLVSHYSPLGKCLSCLKKNRLTVDHVVPLSKNGANSIDNIQCLCYSCNCSKRDKTMDFRPDGVKFAKSLI